MAGEAKIYALGILPNRRNAPNSQKVLEIRSISLFRSLSAVALVKADAFCASLWPKNPCNLWLKICEICVLSFQPRKRTSTKVYVRNYNKNMQNKAKFRKSQMNVNKVLTKDYEEMDTWSTREKTKPNKPKQSQIQKGQNERNFSYNSGLW